jgi:PAS domain-containing protein
MDSASETLERFNRISNVYDETREPLSEEALDKAAFILSKDGCKEILEVGVGTGRIAGPIRSRGFDVVGVDFSRGMLEKAKRKGLANLIIGDANHLPFEEKTFDAAVLAHVLHLLTNPAETFEKLTRVARNDVVAFVRRRDLAGSVASSSFVGDEGGVLIQAFRRAAEEVGYKLSERQGRWRERFIGEVEFLASHPPSELITIQDSEVVTTLGARITVFEKRAYGFPANIPDDVFQRLMERVKESVDPNKAIRYRRVEQMAVWRLTRES